MLKRHRLKNVRSYLAGVLRPFLAFALRHDGRISFQDVVLKEAERIKSHKRSLLKLKGNDSAK